MQARTSVPKFSSFKPLTLPEKSKEDGAKKEGITKKNKHDRKHRHRRQHHRSSSNEDGARHRQHHDISLPKERDEAIFLEENQQDIATLSHSRESLSDLYVDDRKGDKYNVIYGTIHRYNIPQYHRAGFGNVLGLKADYKIDRDSEADSTIFIQRSSWSGDSKRDVNHGLLSRTRTSNRSFRIVPQAISDNNDELFSADFLPFDWRRPRKKRRLSEDDAAIELPESESGDVGYRSILGMAKPEEDIPSDTEIVYSDSDGGGGFVQSETGIQKLNAELYKKVENNPQNVNAWLRLINHQNAVVAGSSQPREMTLAEKESLADIKLSLYEKGLKQVEKDSQVDLFLLRYLEEGTGIWDREKRLNKWRAALKNYPNLISLWIRYLDVLQTDFSSFTFDSSKSTFLECMELNASISSGTAGQYIQAYLFLRMTVFAREAGYTELSIGLWQAVFEFTIFHPDSLHSASKDVKNNSFKDFWESEVLRIGELGAKGWNNTRTFPDTELPSAKLDLELSRLFESWLAAERAQKTNTRTSARSLDEVEDDDPYRVVLVSDVHSFVKFFWKWESPEILIQNFLCYCGLPALTGAGIPEIVRSWRGDPFLRNELLDINDSIIRTPSHRLDEEFRSPLHIFSGIPLNNHVSSLDTMFAQQDAWPCSLKEFKEWAQSATCSIDSDWVHRSLQLLVDSDIMGEDLAEYAVAVEFAFDTKAAKKFAKSLLKKRPSSVRLYNAYSLIECRCGNATAAANIWSTTFSMYPNLNAKERLEYGTIWRTWIWENLKVHEHGKALYLLSAIPLCAVDINSLSEHMPPRSMQPSEFLKSHRFICESQEQVLGEGNIRSFVAWTDCLALLLYTTRNFSLDAGVEVYRKASETLSRSIHLNQSGKNCVDELLHQSRSLLIYHHITSKRIHKPINIRTLLEESLSVNPHNTIFLSLYNWNESRFRVDERVRDVMRTVVSHHPATLATTNPELDTPLLSNLSIPITTHLLAISYEINRPIISGSTIHSVRAAFERAISDPLFQQDHHRTHKSDLFNTTPNVGHNTGKNGPILWKLYILNELSQSQTQRAKEIYYRAIQACPWSKELIILAFTHFNAESKRLLPDSSNRIPSNDKNGKQGTKKKGKGLLEGLMTNNYKDDRDKGLMSFDELRTVYEDALIDRGLRVLVEIGEDALDQEAEARQPRPEQEDTSDSGDDDCDGANRKTDGDQDVEVQRLAQAKKRFKLKKKNLDGGVSGSRRRDEKGLPMGLSRQATSIEKR